MGIEMIMEAWGFEFPFNHRAVFTAEYEALWLRYLIAHYLEAHHRLGLEVTPQAVFAVVPDHHEEASRGYPAYRFMDRREVPLVAVCHQPYAWELHRGYPLVFLGRNAYDVMVSAYFHLSREKAEYAGTMREFISKLGVSVGGPAYTLSREYMLGTVAPRLLQTQRAIEREAGLA